MASQDWDGTCTEAVGGAAGLVGGHPAAASAVPEREAGPGLVCDTGDRSVLMDGPERGEQASTGDEVLEGRQRIASGDAGPQPAGNGPAVEGGGSGGGSVSASPAGPRPISPIRSTQLGELANEVGFDTGIVERFVDDFLRLLDQRLAAVTEALVDSDADGAVTVLRSLETTGSMLGAIDFAEASAALRRAVRDDPGQVDIRLREFTLEAERLRVKLTALSSVLAPSGRAPSSTASTRGARSSGDVQAGGAQSGSASR